MKVARAISGPMLDLIAEVGRQQTSEEQIKELLDRGYFADLLKANVLGVDRLELWKVLNQADRVLKEDFTVMIENRGIIGFADEKRFQESGGSGTLLHLLDSHERIPGLTNHLGEKSIKRFKLVCLDDWSRELTYEQMYHEVVPKRWGSRSYRYATTLELLHVAHKLGFHAGVDIMSFRATAYKDNRQFFLGADGKSANRILYPVYADTLFQGEAILLVYNNV